jgi:hypothetical protein
MAKGDSHMAKNVAKESCCVAPTLSLNILEVIYIYETQKNQVALTGIRTTDLWIAAILEGLCGVDRLTHVGVE